MPTYRYDCDNCTAWDDRNVPVDERDDPVKCTRCGTRMKRAIIAPPVHFKGTGFYKTGG
jgi:putative FmdB family regulatory protein